jgi:hypothetical protein
MSPSPKKKWIALVACSLLLVGALLTLWKRSSPAPNPKAPLVSAPAKDDRTNTPSTDTLANTDPPPGEPQQTINEVLQKKHSQHAVAPIESTTTPDPKLLTDGCYTLTYKHQDLADHRSGEACAQHKNLLTLPSQKIAAKSLCVKVNGTPTKFAFDSKKNQLLLSSIAGVKSEITVRYCTGSAKCAEDCTIPRDEFMEALGAIDQNGSQPSVTWDAGRTAKGPTQEESALDQELLGLKRELAGAERNSEEIFRGWSAEKEKPLHCKAQPGKVAKL